MSDQSLLLVLTVKENPSLPYYHRFRATVLLQDRELVTAWGISEEEAKVRVFDLFAESFKELA